MNLSSQNSKAKCASKSERKRRRKEYRKTAELQTEIEAEERRKWLEETKPEVVKIETRLELEPSTKLTRKERRLLKEYFLVSGESTTISELRKRRKTRAFIRRRFIRIAVSIVLGLLIGWIYFIGVLILFAGGAPIFHNLFQATYIMDYEMLAGWLFISALSALLIYVTDSNLRGN